MIRTQLATWRHEYRITNRWWCLWRRTTMPLHPPEGRNYLRYPVRVPVAKASRHRSLTHSFEVVAEGARNESHFVGDAVLIAPRTYRMPVRGWGHVPSGDWRSHEGEMTLAAFVLMPRAHFCEENRGGEYDD